jgi:RNA-directed DNA polymerase
LETISTRLEFIMNNVAEEMRHLNELAKRDPGKRFTKLWNNLTDMRWLAQAWEEIRRNKGSQTRGVNKTVAVDVDLALIERLKSELETDRYRPSPVRRVLIPKANGKTRPLGIANLEDRIVQQAIRMLLEPIFEADFLSCSHGFRQGKSTHTALRDVAGWYPSTTWIIEGDIEGCYDNIPTGLLVNQIKRRIADEKVWLSRN